MPDPAAPFPLLPVEALIAPPDADERLAQARARREDGEALAALVLPAMRGRDFAGRIRRKDMTSLRHQHRRPHRLIQRAGGIAAIGALGLVLGALGWGEPGMDRASAQERLAALAPFSATNTLPATRLPQAQPEAPSDAGLLAPQDASRAWEERMASIHGDDEPSATWRANPAARPLFATGSGEDRWRALQCLTTAIYYEAASEPDGGQRAVAQVVLNRVAHPAFPKTVCGVVFQGSERPGCQFSFACDGAMARRPMQVFWDRARRIAADALAGFVYAPVGLATHYHTSAVHPVWADKLAFIGTIGAHRFYRWSGSAGQPLAFSGTYRGAEPLAAPHPRSWVSNAVDLADPLTLEKAFEEGRMAALDRAVPASSADAARPVSLPRAQAAAHNGAPALAGPSSGSGAVRPEASEIYENAGKWISQPGS